MHTLYNKPLVVLFAHLPHTHTQIPRIPARTQKEKNQQPIRKASIMQSIQ